MVPSRALSALFWRMRFGRTQVLLSWGSLFGFFLRIGSPNLDLWARRAALNQEYGGWAVRSLCSIGCCHWRCLCSWAALIAQVESENQAQPTHVLCFGFCSAI
jgi:hypothetical protein